MREFWVGVIAALVLCGALWGGYIYLNREPERIAEQPAPAVKQEDGSIIAARAPDAKVKPKQMIPKGAKLERTAEIKAQGETPAGAAVPCPPVTVDTSLIREADGGHRLVVSSPNGQVLSAVDTPVDTFHFADDQHAWAAGVKIDPLRQRITGAMVQRDIWRVRVGIEGNFDPRPGEPRIGMHVLWTF